MAKKIKEEVIDLGAGVDNLFLTNKSMRLHR